MPWPPVVHFVAMIAILLTESIIKYHKSLHFMIHNGTSTHIFFIQNQKNKMIFWKEIMFQVFAPSPITYILEHTTETRLKTG